MPNEAKTLKIIIHGLVWRSSSEFFPLREFLEQDGSHVLTFEGYSKESYKSMMTESFSEKVDELVKIIEDSDYENYELICYSAGSHVATNVMNKSKKNITMFSVAPSYKIHKISGINVVIRLTGRKIFNPTELDKETKYNQKGMIGSIFFILRISKLYRKQLLDPENKYFLVSFKDDVVKSEAFYKKTDVRFKIWVDDFNHEEIFTGKFHIFKDGYKGIKDNK